MTKIQHLYWGKEIKAYFSGVPVEYCHGGTKEWIPLTDANLFNNDKINFRIKPTSSEYKKKMVHVYTDGTVSIVKDINKELFADILIWMCDNKVDYLEIVK